MKRNWSIAPDPPINQRINSRHHLKHCGTADPNSWTIRLSLSNDPSHYVSGGSDDSSAR